MAPDTSSNSASTVQDAQPTATKVSEMSKDELLETIQAAVAGLPDATASALASVLDKDAQQLTTVGGTVALDDSQFSRLSELGGAGLHTSVFGVGFLALILGAVVGVALTLHWRGSRNG